MTASEFKEFISNLVNAAQEGRISNAEFFQTLQDAPPVEDTPEPTENYEDDICEICGIAH